MLKNIKKMSKVCPLKTKNERKLFAKMKTSNFILHGRKSKLTIRVTANIFYPLFLIGQNQYGECLQIHVSFYKFFFS
jgi:hypothetical protein